MTKFKMKQFFNLAFTALTVSMMASTLFAGSGYGIDDVQDDTVGADETDNSIAFVAPASPLDLEKEDPARLQLHLKNCKIDRSTVDLRMERYLQEKKISSRATYGIYDFRLELGLSEEDSQKFVATVAKTFLVSVSPAKAAKITNSEQLIGFVVRERNRMCAE